MSAEQLELVGAELLDDLAALEPIAEAVFGRGDRRPGWFARKLDREGVEARLSTVVRRGDELLGYALLGRAASLGATARGAGVGLLAPLRGQGLGGRLLAHAAARARAAGCDALEFLAEPARLPWYEAQGFVAVEEQLALLAAATGELTAADLGERPAPARDDAAALWSWIPEIWTRTPARERSYVELEGLRLWLSREGRAWLVHRGELDDPAALLPGLAALRRELPRQTPVLLYPCPAASAWLGQLREVGFGPAQRSFVVRRGL